MKNIFNKLINRFGKMNLRDTFSLASIPHFVGRSLLFLIKITKVVSNNVTFYWVVAGVGAYGVVFGIDAFIASFAVGFIAG